MQPSDLFIGAMRGMYGLMADIDAPSADAWRQIEVEGLDKESLLVDWLNELLFFTETEGLLFIEAQIRTLTPTRLVARAGGVLSPITKASIKAATFHDLAISRDGDGWSVVITFDV
jgi:SHS2 domain-containing protein